MGDFINGIKAAVDLDFTEAIYAGAKTARVDRRLSLEALRHMALAVKERIVALAKRVEDGCCDCEDGKVWRETRATDPQHSVLWLDHVWERCRCPCHKHETTRPELPPKGRTQIEMDDDEYERMRAALGSKWEWQGLVRIWER